MHILVPHLSCAVYAPVGDNTENSEFDQALAAGYSEIYVICHNGIVKYHKLRGQGRYVTIKVDSIPGLKLHDIGQNVSSFLPQGLVPYNLLEQVEAFFRQVSATHKSDLEAMIWVMYSPEQGYFLHVPEQRISKASVSYDWEGVPAGSSIIVDIHSHNTMGAFFSGTDDNDDRSGVRFSGVFGRLQDAVPATVWRFNYMGKKIEAKLADIFQSAPERSVEIPKEWLGQVKVSAPTYYNNGRTYQGGQGGQSWQFPKSYSARGTGAPKQTIASGEDSVTPGRHNFQDPYEFQGQAWGDDERGSQANHAGDATKSQSKGVTKPFHQFVTEQNALLYGRGDSEQAARRELWESAVGYFPQEGEEAGKGRETEETSYRLARGIILSEDDVDPVGSAILMDGDAGISGSAESVEGVEMTHSGLYELLAVEYGTEIADAYDAIDTSMVDLEGQDELLGTLTGEMIGLIGEDSVKLDLLRNIANSLSNEARDKLMTHGL